MTSLTITPNIENKSAKFKGKVASGEKVDVTISGLGSLAASTTMYLRVTYGPITIAQFPQPVEEGETADTWTQDGDNLKCTLNLNTVQALKWCAAPENAAMIILEELGSDDGETTPPQLFFCAPIVISMWPHRIKDESPFDLSKFPSLIALWQRQLSLIAAQVTKEGGTATITLRDKDGNVTQAQVSDGADGVSPIITTVKTATGYDVTITDKEGTKKVSLTNGTDGTNGVTFTPSVSAEGVISWTNDGGKANPSAVSIKGVPGNDGVGIKNFSFVREDPVTGNYVYALQMSDGTAYALTVPRGKTGGYNILAGERFVTPKSYRQLNSTLLYVIQKMGGTIDGSALPVTPEEATEVLYIKDSSGVAHAVRIVTIDGENTLEVE